MTYIEICQARDKFLNLKKNISPEAYRTIENSFNIEYTHNSTAIEGNTLTLLETKTVIEDMISIGGKSLREIYEVVNHNNAFSYVKKCLSENKTFSEEILKNIHSILMDNIQMGEVYRNETVRISGASFKPPIPNEIYYQIKEFYRQIDEFIKKPEFNAVELAAYTHAEFVRIHPFTDGNGRTARLIMNYQLMNNKFLPISISKDSRLQYYDALNYYATSKNISKFYDFILELEYSSLKELTSEFSVERKDEIER